jgi:hypothetical protein
MCPLSNVNGRKIFISMVEEHYRSQQRQNLRCDCPGKRRLHTCIIRTYVLYSPMHFNKLLVPAGNLPPGKTCAVVCSRMAPRGRGLEPIQPGAPRALDKPRVLG